VVPAPIVPSQTTLPQTPFRQVVPGAQKSVAVQVAPAATNARQVPVLALASASAMQIPTHVTLALLASHDAPGNATFAATHVEVVASQNASGPAGSHTITSLGLHAAPADGSFVHLFTLRLQYALAGQTWLLLHPSPMATGATQTLVSAFGAVGKQTRGFAQLVEALQKPPTLIGTIQLPHMAAAPSASHRPLAHCHELLQEPPFATVPPCGMQPATCGRPRNWSQLIAPMASPHCCAICGVQPLWTACAVVSHDCR
jgi:hypothetical protein